MIWIFMVFLCQQPLSTSDYLMEKRVIGGRTPNAEDHMYAISLRGDDPDKKSSMFCGATLISPLWIITAAHCFLGHSKRGIPFKNPALWTVQAGSKSIDLKWAPPAAAKSLNVPQPHHQQPIPGPYYTPQDYFPWYGWFAGMTRKNVNHKFAEENRTEKAQTLYLTRVIQHPNYMEHDIEWDIALAKLSQPITWITPVNLPYHHQLQQVAKSRNNARNNRMQQPKVGTVCEMIGWGCHYMGGPAVEQASLAKLQVVSHEQCNQWYQNGAGLSPVNEFCAGYYKKNIGVCPGDSGSGLFCQSQGKWYIEGVTSATHRDFPEAYPGIFSRVSFYLKWIEQTVAKF